MGEFAYRLDHEESERIRRSFSWFGFYFLLGLQYLMSILFIFGIVKFAWRVVSFPLRLLFTKREDVFIKEIVLDRAIGSNWFFWTFVTFVSGDGRETTLHLSPRQAVRFVVQQAGVAGDGGTLKRFGGRLIGWRRSARSAERVPTAFLSYPHERQQEAELVSNVLKSQGLEVWLDKEKLWAGDSLPAAVSGAIDKAACFFPLLCPEYVASKWCLKELERACREGQTLLVRPIKISSGSFFQPAFVQELLENVGEPLFVDLNSADGMEQLRNIAQCLAEGLRIATLQPKNALASDQPTNVLKTPS